MLAGTHVLLGVTGSIAAYQAADLIGLLKNQLASVRVVMTCSATRFITPLTLEVISGHPVTVDMFEGTRHEYVEHIALATGADLLLVAPATANIIGKLANSIADDMLSTTALAVTAPVLVAPAMNEKMWMNPAVQANVERLRTRGVFFVDPEYGPMACGGDGWGRLARLEEIVRRASDVVRQAEPGAPQRLEETLVPARGRRMSSVEANDAGGDRNAHGSRSLSEDQAVDVVVTGMLR